MTCPCGCGKSVRPGRKYASHGCWPRTQDREKVRRWGVSGGRASAASRNRVMRVSDFYAMRHDR